MGRALADLDPTGVGRDLMFVHDGQFGFSLFRPRGGRIGVGVSASALAAKSLAILAAFAWFFGIRAFAGQFAKGATVWVAVIFTALLPNAYGRKSYPLGFAELNRHPAPFRRGLGAGRARRACAASRDGVALVFIAAAALASSDHGARRSCGRPWRSRLGRQALVLGFCARCGALDLGRLAWVPRSWTGLFTVVDPSR